MEILKKIKETISKYYMLSEGDCVLVGLSGGPDSVCLAVILDKLKTDFNLSLHAVYIDHGLRPDEVLHEKEFCRGFCERTGIEFYTETADIKGFAKDEGLNIQEAARDLRYRIFDNIACKIKADKIALGHNAEDRVETLLINLFRGTGRKGLSGIPPVRGKIIRPLIEIERKEIEEFLLKEVIAIGGSHLQLPFVIDSSNLNEKYFRNWIRLKLLTEIKQKDSAFVQNMCRTMDILKEEDDYLEIIVTKTLMRLISRKSDDAIELFLSPLERIEKPLLRRILRRVFEETEGLKGINFVHIEDILRLIKKGKSGDRLYLPRRMRVIKDYSLLKITSVLPLSISEYEISPPCEVTIKESSEVIRAEFDEKSDGSIDGRISARLDADLMKFPLIIRARSAGDFFYPTGLGKRKKLQDFFVDEKIPRDERDKVPIVVSGKDIVWVAGYRADERFKVTDKTEKYLKLIITKTR